MGIFLEYWGIGLVWYGTRLLCKLQSIEDVVVVSGWAPVCLIFVWLGYVCAALHLV